MKPQLFQYQKDLIEKYKPKKKWGLWLGTGTTKTVIALKMAEGKTLVIVPKILRMGRVWEKTNEEFETNVDLTVVSKEEFKKKQKELTGFQTVIVDEAHYFFSGLSPETKVVKGVSIPKMSQLFMSLVEFIKRENPEKLYLLTATPFSKPMSVFAVGLLFGVFTREQFWTFRARYYTEVKMGFRSMWLPKKDSRSYQELLHILSKLGIFGKLSDFFDVPEQTEIVKFCYLTPEQKKEIAEIKQTEADPMAVRARIRTIENGILYQDSIVSMQGKEITMGKSTKFFKNEKIAHILELAQEFEKMVIFANWTGQIQYIENVLKDEGYTVLLLTGQSKNRETVIEEAEKAEKVIIIIQSTISAGYGLPSFPCCVFASKNWQHLHYDQAKGRILRAGHLKKILYGHLVLKDGVDEDCHKSIMGGKDFYEKKYD